MQGNKDMSGPSVFLFLSQLEFCFELVAPPEHIHHCASCVPSTVFICGLAPHLVDPRKQIALSPRKHPLASVAPPNSLDYHMHIHIFAFQYSHGAILRFVFR
jgi:hypothetical protein